MHPRLVVFLAQGPGYPPAGLIAARHPPMLGSMPLAEEAVATIVGKRMAVAGEAKAHLAIAGDLDAILLASTKLYGLFEDGTTGAAHGTIVGSSFIHTG